MRLDSGARLCYLNGIVSEKGVTKGYTTTGVVLRDAFFSCKEVACGMIQVNGQALPLEGETTVLALLEERGLRPDRVAVERNGAIVPRAEFAATVLEAGDRLEIVRFVGGG